MKRRSKEVLETHVLQHAIQVRRALRTSFFTNYLINDNRKNLRKLTMRLNNLNKLNRYIRTMGEENLENIDKDLKLIEYEIEKLRKFEEFRLSVKNKNTIGDRKQYNSNNNSNKKIINIPKNHNSFDHITNATPRLKTKNKLLNMSTG